MARRKAAHKPKKPKAKRPATRPKRAVKPRPSARIRRPDRPGDPLAGMTVEQLIQWGKGNVAKAGRVEVTSNPLCLHCQVRDLAADMIEDGMVTSHAAVGHIGNALAEIISWAPGELPSKIVALLVAELPAKVERKVAALVAKLPIPEEH
jgi:hypothetical protein